MRRSGGRGVGKQLPKNEKLFPWEELFIFVIHLAKCRSTLHLIYSGCLRRRYLVQSYFVIVNSLKIGPQATLLKWFYAHSYKSNILKYC